LFLQAQAMLGLGQQAEARKLSEQVLKRDPNHAMASDLSGVPAQPNVNGFESHSIKANQVNLPEVDEIEFRAQEPARPRTSKTASMSV